MKVYKSNIPINRTLKFLSLSFTVLFFLLLITIALLPTIIGAPALQNRIQKSLSTSMKRQVSWTNFAIGWFDGIKLTGLKLGDGPPPLLKTSVDQIAVVPSIGRNGGRFALGLLVSIKNVHAELAPGTPKPKPTPSGKDPLTLAAEAIEKIQGVDFPLPVDVRVMIDAAPLNVLYRAPAPARQLSLSDFSFSLAMPSLATMPVTASISGLVSVEGRALGKICLNAGVSDLVGKERRLRLATALFAVDASAPGTNLGVNGGLNSADGLSARCRFDFPRLFEVAGPFLPPALPKLAGNAELKLLAKADGKRDIHAAVTFSGNSLAVSGGSLKTKRVGLLDLTLQQNIATDHLRQRVDFSGGKIAIKGLMDAAWSAAVTRPTSQERSLVASFGPLRLNLAKTMAIAAQFLPPETPLKNLAGEMTLRSLNLKLEGPGNNGDFALSDFSAKLPHIRLALTKGALSAENIDVTLDKLQFPIFRTLPTKLTADLHWRFRSATLSGAEPVNLQGGRGTLGIAVNDLNLKSKSPRKVTASAIVRQTADLDHASFGTKLDINNIHKQLRLLARAEESGEIVASLPEFFIAVGALKGSQGGKHFGPLPLSVNLAATDIRLAPVKGAKPSLGRASAEINAGDFMHLTAVAALSGGFPQNAISSGTVRLDLQRAILFAAPFMPAGLKGEGIASVFWNMAAPLPKKPFVADKNPLRTARAGLALCDKFDLTLKLDNISAKVPLGNGAASVTGLRSKPDLRFVSSKKGASLLLEGGVQMSGISGFPGAAGKLTSQRMSLLFNGELTDWSALVLHEEMRVEPLAVSHEAELNVDRLNTLLDEKQPFSTATLIKCLDATLFASADAALSSEFKQLLPGMDLGGNFSGSARVDLSAGRELSIRAAIKTRNFGVQLENGTKVDGMRADITLNRLYSLAAQSGGDRWTPLSFALVRPAAIISANQGAAEIVGRVHEDLRGDQSGARSFSIKRVTTKTSSGAPLVLTALEGDLLLSQEKTGLSFFQCDLLGGTLLARSVFDLKPEVPVIALDGSFSNLDITRLLPKDAKKRRLNEDAEITGEMRLTAPLTAEQRELFEQLRLTLNLRRIGADTIERALFSLDPYEQNEQVVAQRKTLRLGTLKGLRATAVDGALSMEGEVNIRGVPIDIPKVERLRISELPKRQELVKNRKAIKALRGLLDLVRADTLGVGSKGEILLKRRGYEK